MAKQEIKKTPSFILTPMQLVAGSTISGLPYEGQEYI